MVVKWKKLVDKIIKSWNRKDLALKIEDIILWNNLWNYDIKPYDRIIFEKTENWNKIIEINKRWDIY